MPMYDISGAYDMHVHTGPDFVDRIGDDVEVATACEKAGMKGLLLKAHMECTVSRAYHTQKQCGNIRVYGSLVLGGTTGGFNPFAAEAAMKAGAKQVFMPTFASAADFAVHGGEGETRIHKYGLKTTIEPLSALEVDGTVKKTIADILELSRDYNVPIGTSHLSFEEILPIARFARDIGSRLIVTHPEYKIPNLSAPQLKELTALGALVELTAGAVFPIPGCSTIARDVEIVREVGYRNIFISSDAGTPTKPMPAETLSSFLYCLQKKGIPSDQLDYMLKENPVRVFSL